MGKHEFLPFKMTVENGRLVPATPYDQERLLTWTKGSKVNVVFVRDGGRVMERKWWAILNRAVKECKTPWKTSAEASEAIKISIGVTNYTKTVGGEFLTYPKSLTELDDPELDDAVLLMIDIVYRVTGVDPAEWKRQVEHIRDEPTEHNSTSAATPGDDVDGIGTAAPSTSPDDPEISSQETAEEGSNPGTAAPSSASISDADRAWLVRVFKTMRNCVGPDVGDFTRSALIFKDEIAGKSSLVKAKASTIRTKLEECCGDAPKIGTMQAAKYLAGVIGVDEKDLV